MEAVCRRQRQRLMLSPPNMDPADGGEEGICEGGDVGRVEAADNDERSAQEQTLDLNCCACLKIPNDAVQCPSQHSCCRSCRIANGACPTCKSTEPAIELRLVPLLHDLSIS